MTSFDHHLAAVEVGAGFVGVGGQVLGVGEEGEAAVGGGGLEERFCRSGAEGAFRFPHFVEARGFPTRRVAHIQAVSRFSARPAAEERPRAVFRERAAQRGLPGAELRRDRFAAFGFRQHAQRLGRSPRQAIQRPCGRPGEE